MSSEELAEMIATMSSEAVTAPSPAAASPISGAVVGVLVGFRDNGATPLVMFPGQPTHAAVPARSTVDLHGVHIGRQTVLIFERGEPHLPIITALMRVTEPWPLRKRPGTVEVDADGERLIVSAREQLVLQCGKASITLTKEGKVLIQGTYVSSRSSGVHRIKGGSVQVN